MNNLPGDQGAAQGQGVQGQAEAREEEERQQNIQLRQAKLLEKFNCIIRNLPKFSHGPRELPRAKTSIHVMVHLQPDVIFHGAPAEDLLIDVTHWASDKGKQAVWANKP